MEIKKQWYTNLDISPTGKPTGIGKIAHILTEGVCYCIVSQGGIVIRVDVYSNGERVHYKKFGYDDHGRVIENAMYSPNGNGGWHIIDDIWYYEYDRKTGKRSKKIMRMLGATTAREISYDQNGNRVDEKEIIL